MALSPRYTGRPAAEEAVNDPTTPKHYWRYRIHVRLEELLADAELLGELQGLNLAAGRCTAAELLPPSAAAAGGGGRGSAGGGPSGPAPAPPSPPPRGGAGRR